MLKSGLAQFFGLQEAQAFGAELQYAQDYIPIRDIDRGMIITNDGRYIKVLEILPTNFLLKTEDEQESLIYNYASWLNISPMKTQLKIITRKADTSELINFVQQKLRYETNDNCIKIGNNYCNLIHVIGASTAVSRRFFLIFQYEPESEAHRLTDESAIAAELNLKAVQIKEYFSKCNNTVIMPENENAFIAEFLYLYYNKQSSITEPFSSRVIRVENDIRTLNDLEASEESPKIDVCDLLAPRGIDFNSQGYCIIDGIYQSHLYLDGNRLPEEVQAGWLTPIIALGDGIDVDIFSERCNIGDMQTKISNKMKFTGIKLSQREQHQQDYEQIRKGMRGCSGMQALMGNDEDPYYVSIFITISAETYDELMFKKQKVLSRLKARKTPAHACDLQEEEAFRSVSPFLTLSPKLFKRSRRNLTTSGLACCYPYTAYELYDKHGIMIGTNANNFSLCAINPFDTKKYVNANLCVLGTSGAGKTYTCQLIELRFRISGCQCFIITPDKQHEFIRSAKAIGGSFINISPSSKDTINLMEIRPSVSPVAELLDGITLDDKTWLADKVQTIKTFFSLLITKPELNDEEFELLDAAIINTYAKKGITNDNNSLFLDPQDQTKGLKQMPILEDLYDELSSNPDMPRRLKHILKQFVTGSAQSFNGPTNVDLDNKYIVFGLEELKNSKLLAPAMFMVLDLVYGKAKEDRTKTKSILINEGWQLVNGSNLQAAAFVQNIFKVIRGYGGSAIFETQDLSDLYALENGKFGKAIVNCSEIKIILRLKREEAKLVQYTLNLSDGEVQQIINFDRGDALLCASDNHAPVHIKASPFEHDFITTDRTDLEAQLNQLQEDKNTNTTGGSHA